tara:strand:- start:50 stop:571 length:522 start_codon:yes stop_codon:yes gene_type:complete
MDFVLQFLLLASVYLTIALALVAVSAGVTFARSKMTFKEWLAQGKAKGAVASAVLGIGSILALAFVLYSGSALLSGQARAGAYSDMFKDGTWLNDTSVRLGLDWTLKQSPQCKSGGIDEKGTSNLGITQNIWQSADKQFRWNLGYTHHSCFLGADRNGYDGFGTEVEWYIFRK